MTNFKIGEKVVYVGVETDKTYRIPQKNEIITICEIRPDGVACEEYLIANDGEEQLFDFNELRKIDHDFANDLISKIKEEQLTQIL